MKRRLGILGAPLGGGEDSEDSDYAPPPPAPASASAEPSPSKRRRPGSGPHSDSDSDEEGADEPLAARQRRLAAAPRQQRAPAPAPASAEPSPSRRRRPGCRPHSDSDEEGADEPLAARQRRLAAAPRQQQQRAPPPAAAANGDGASCSGGDSAPWGTLPPDVLRAVFAKATARNAVPAALALPRVCRAWRAVALAMGAELYGARIDLAAAPRGRAKGGRGSWDAVLAALGGAGLLRSLRALAVAGCASVSERGLLAVAAAAPQLSELSIAGCTALRQAGLEAAIAAMPRLRVFKMSEAVVQPRQGGADRVVRAALAAGVEVLIAEGVAALGGGALRALAPEPPPAAAPPAAAASAPASPAGGVPRSPPPPPLGGGGGAAALRGLRELRLTKSGRVCSGLTLHIGRLQAACPALEVLALAGLGGIFGFEPRGVQAPAAGEGRGFPCLRVCEVGVALVPDAYSSSQRVGTSFINDASLLRICGAAEGLAELDITGTRVTAGGLAALPARRLRVLAVAKSAVASDEGLAVVAALYGGTLRVLTAGQAGSGVGDAGVAALGPCAGLERLDVSASGVSDGGLRALLRSPAGGSLRELNVASCRSLGRPARTAAAGGAGLAALVAALRQ